MSKSIDLADEILIALQAAWNGSATPMGPTDTCERRWLAPVTRQGLKSLIGRRLFLAPAEYTTSPETRRSDRRDTGVWIIIAERYTDAAEEVPTAWIDGRVAFVEDVIVPALGDERTQFVFGTPERRVSTGSIRVELYDPELLNDSKVFLSSIDVTFTEAE